MAKYAVILFGGLILIGIGVLFWNPAKRFMLQDICLDSRGKWASNGNYCIYRNCAEEGSCRPSYSNNQACRSLSLPISFSELCFHLGMPVTQKDSVLTFAPGAGGAQIQATLDNGVVTKLDCGS